MFRIKLDDFNQNTELILGMTKFDEYREKFIDRKTIEDVPEDHIVFFVIFFVETYCMEFCKRKFVHKVSRPPLPLKNMLGLILLSEILKESSARKIADFTKTDSVYKLVMEDIPVSKESVTRYKNYFMPHFKGILGKTVQMAKDLGLSDFIDVSVDGTKIKAYNSNYKVIRKHDLKILIKVLKGELGKEEVKKLKWNARKFYYDERKTLTEKLELLERMYAELQISGQKSVPVNDIEARWMYNKKNKAELSYNLQTCVDCATHLILATYISQNPTDDYDLPIVTDMAMKNVGFKFENLLADAGYCNELVIDYLQKSQIEGFIPNATQSRENKDALKTNPTSKDNVYIDYINKYIVCFAGYLFPLKYQYREENVKKTSIGKIRLPDKIKSFYSNSEACKNCFYKDQCLTEKMTNRQYIVYGSEAMIDMLLKMETPEAKEKYSLRPVVESPYGTLKQFYELNQLPYIGKYKIQGIVNLKSIAYNIIRISNLVLCDLLFENETYMNFVQKTIDKYTAKN